MSYISIQEYMDFAGITTLDAITSTKISAILDSTKSIIDNVIGDVSLSQKTQQIKYCDIARMYWFYDTIACQNIEIQSLDEINWKSYTWVLNTDYQITPPLKSRIVIRNIASYINGLIFDWFEIKYTSGFSTIPNDIKYLQYLMASWEIAKQNWQEVKSYTLWPRKVEFKDEVALNKSMAIISNYSLINL